jgi:hypothetical protein
MKDGETIHYVFTSFETCTHFWDSISVELFEIYTRVVGEKYFFIEPNPFWHILFPDHSDRFSLVLQEKGYLPHMVMRKPKTQRQKDFVKRLRSSGYQISFSEKIGNLNEEITVFGDYIIRAKHNKLASNDLYEKIITGESLSVLRRGIEKTMKPIVFDIVRNRLVAEKLRKRYMKLFV